MKYKTIDDLPLILTVKDISQVLNIALVKAYDLCHSEGFPSKTIGKRIIVPKLAFVKWMENL
jgi:hypothetical protein